MYFPRAARQPKRLKQRNVLHFDGFPYGLNTALSEYHIDQRELAECVNWRIVEKGQLRTRRPIRRYSNSATDASAAVKFFTSVSIDGTVFDLLVDANNKLYYLDGSLDPQNIATLEGEGFVFGYKDKAIICDTGYLKYVETTGGVPTVIKICYDDGTGSTAYQFNNRTGSDDTELALGHTNDRISYKFTSQNWTATYTIPPTTFTAILKRVGNGYAGTDNVEITAKLRKVSDDSVMASKTFLAAPIEDNVATASTEYSITFAASDITNEMAPNTAYYMSLEYNNGDGSNYVSVRCTTVASGGAGWNYPTGGPWAQNATKDPIMGLRPGMPPKASFGVVHEGRPFIKDAANVGRLYYGNLTYLDWSTTDGGGYLTIKGADDDAQEIGSIQPIYADLYIFGTEAEPFLGKLAGLYPTDWRIDQLFQNASATQKTSIVTANDIWFANITGVDPLTGVQEYGDLRTFSASDPVYDSMRYNFVEATAMAAYYPKDGQYWLHMPTYPRILVCHTKQPIEGPDGRMRYPWAEYEFGINPIEYNSYKWNVSAGNPQERYLTFDGIAPGSDPCIAIKPDHVLCKMIQQDPLDEATVGSLAEDQWGYGDHASDSLGFDTIYINEAVSNIFHDIRLIWAPTSLNTTKDGIFIGFADGYVYKVSDDEAVYKDHIPPMSKTLVEYRPTQSLKSKYVRFPFGSVNLIKQQFDVVAKFGGIFAVHIKVDDSALEYFPSTHNTDGSGITHCYSYGMTSDGSTFDEHFSDPPGLHDYITAGQDVMFRQMNQNGFAFQVRCYPFAAISHTPIYFNGFMLMYRRLEH